MDARSGKNNRTGTIVASTKTDNNGAYALNLPKGDYTLQITKKNFVGYYLNVALTGNKTVSTPITQTIPSTKYRVVLSWGTSPRDLDLHVTGPTNTSSRFHVYWKKENKSYILNGIRLAVLDVDNRECYGPETVTLDLSKRVSGTYHFYVHNFSEGGNTKSSTLSKSGAKVDVYSGNQMLASYSVPNQAGTVWHVFDLVNGQPIVSNKMSYDRKLLTQ